MFSVCYRQCQESHGCCTSAFDPLAFHRYCECETLSRELGICKKECNKDLHCQGFVELLDLGVCHIATNSTCPTDVLLKDNTTIQCFEYFDRNKGPLVQGKCGDANAFNGCWIKIGSFSNLNLLILLNKKKSYESTLNDSNYCQDIRITYVITSWY